MAAILARPLLYTLAGEVYRNFVIHLLKKYLPNLAYMRLFSPRLISTSPPIVMDVFNGLPGLTTLASVVPTARNTLVRRTTPFILDSPRPIVESQRFMISNGGVSASNIISPEKIGLLP